MAELRGNYPLEPGTEVPGETIFEAVAAIILVLVLSAGGAAYFGIAPW